MIAIDPGAGGGIAWIAADGSVHAAKMPEGMTAICDVLIEFRGQLSYHIGVPAPAVMELVHAMPGDGRASVGSFLRHCGWLDAALYLSGYSVTSVTPAKWQSGIGVPRGETLPKDMAPAVKRAELARRKAERKAWIKEQMQRRYPHIRVTLHTADALGILTWAQSCARHAQAHEETPKPT